MWSPDSRSFTVTSNRGLLRTLRTECRIGAAFDPTSPDGVAAADKIAAANPFKALWDTGASSTVISQAVVDGCGLKQIGMQRVHHAGGTADQPVYLIAVGLPNRVMFPSIRVVLGQLTGIDVLIGMDIITRGDFSVTNVGQRTKFSFRVPSAVEVDFVMEHNQNNQRLKFKHGGTANRKKAPKRHGRNKHK